MPLTERSDGEADSRAAFTTESLASMIVNWSESDNESIQPIKSIDNYSLERNLILDMWLSFPSI